MAEVTYKKSLLDPIIFPFAFIFLYFVRFITGKPGSPLNYAAELLEKNFNIRIPLINIGTRLVNDGFTYYCFEKGKELLPSDLGKISKVLHINNQYLRITKDEENRIVLRIDNHGLDQLERWTQTFPNLWQRITARFFVDNNQVLRNTKDN